MIHNIKNLNKDRGFTIVELLIVIVVIGILAAITIVAYNGVQNRARTTEAQSNAKEVQTKAEIHAADAGNGVYPATASVEGMTGTAALSQKVKDMINDTTASTTPTANGMISYVACGTSPNFTGAKIGYWDSVAGAARYLAAGTANTINTAATC
ncbi:MAG TPA: type II secretion system protein [Candidatus Saccharimonadales bacterium]|nr:type II secretion system protein [Candidatus Saccharimonadales bacterium]